jgi:lipid A 3-O-deacylase
MKNCASQAESVPQTTLKSILCSLIVAAAFVGAPAKAVDGMSLELGSGDGTNMGRIGVQWDWNRKWLQTGGWHVGGYWDLSLGYWDAGTVPAGRNGSIVDIGLTPVFRIQQNDLRGLYGEIAVGFHLLSHTTIGSKTLSTAYQFGDHFGVGYRFGDKGQYDLGYRYQHLSNGGIKKPNNGINFNQIRFQYRF